MADRLDLKSDDYLPTMLAMLAPAWIDHVLRFHGRPPPRPPGRTPFRYLDLGCGVGATLLALAAAYPEAAFVGVDASPSHIRQGAALATAAGLGNVRFIAGRFGDAAVGDLDPVDYIVANGVYTWVGPEAQADFRAAIARLLKPGGAAVVSANNVVGWLTLAPMRRLVADLSAAAGARTPADVHAEAMAWTRRVREAAGQPFIATVAERFGESFGGLPPAYFMHEMLADAWRPLWTTDLAEDFAAIGLDYLSGADLAALRDDFALTAAQRALLEDAPSRAAALTLRDSFLARAHVHAVFHRPDRGARDVSRLDGWARLERPAADVEYAAATPGGRLKFDNAVARSVVAALAGGAASLRDVAAAAGASGETAFLRVTDSLFASGQAAPCDPPAGEDAVRRLNALLAAAAPDLVRVADAAGTPRPKAAGINRV